VYGCNSEGERTRAGGWGYLLGDEGSGYSIGLAALRAILRAYDGRGENTRLHTSILNHLSLTAPTELVKYIYRERVPTTEIASLSSLVEAAVDEGDAVAIHILQEAASELALAVKSVVSRLRMNGEIPCALAGGVIVNGRSFRQKFEQSANQTGIGLNPIEVVHEPAKGAIRLAKQL
jgi:N-acetylglucosamine kinase-like BadF-type ATPase